MDNIWKIQEKIYSFRNLFYPGYSVCI